jgi:hypothetical protein
MQSNDVLLIGINEALQLPLQILALDLDPIQLVLELALLSSLDLLPQGIFLENDLRLLEQLTDPRPHQRIETVGPYPTRGATLHAPHRHAVFASTAIIQILITFANAQLPRRLHMQLTLATPHQGAQEIAL